MILSAGLYVLYDTYPYTVSTIPSAPFLIDNVYWTGSQLTWATHSAYGADLGSSQRAVRIELSGQLPSFIGTPIGWKNGNILPVEVFTSEDNAYWTSRGSYLPELLFYDNVPLGFTLRIEITDENAIGRYIKVVVLDGNRQIQGTSSYSAGGICEIDIFGFEGEGFVDVPLPEAADNFFLAAGDCDIAVPDCVDFEGEGICDLPEIDAVGYATIRYTSELDIILPDAVSGSVSAIGNCDILLPVADGRAFAGYLEAFGECDLILLEAFSDAVESAVLGELLLPDAEGSAVVGKYAFGECYIPLPFAVGSAVRGMYAFGECDIFLPEVVSLNALLLALGECDIPLPDCPKWLYVPPVTVPSSNLDDIRLEYWNVY